MLKENLSLNFGFKLSDLYDRDGLVRLHHRFLSFLKSNTPEIHDLYDKSFQKPKCEAPQVSDVILKVGTYLDQFISELFYVDSKVLEDQKTLSKEHKDLFSVFTKQFMQRYVQRKYSKTEAKKVDIKHLGLDEDTSDFPKVFAIKVLEWLKNPEQYSTELGYCAQYAAWGLYSKKCPKTLKSLFAAPQKLN